METDSTSYANTSANASSSSSTACRSKPKSNSQNARGENPPSLLPGGYFTVTAKTPEQAEEFAFTASPIFFNVFLFIRVEGEAKGLREVLPPGGESKPFADFRST